jgi:hypothetical protein
MTSGRRERHADGLVDVDGAAVAVPQRLELLEVLDEEAVHGDTVAVHDEAVVAPVGVPR